MKVAWVKGGVVVKVLEVQEARKVPSPPGTFLVEVPEDVDPEQGWTYTDGVFSAP